MNPLDRQLVAMEIKAKAQQTLAAFNTAIAVEGYNEDLRRIGRMAIENYECGRIRASTFIMLAETNMTVARRSFVEEAKRMHTFEKAQEMHARLQNILISDEALRVRLNAALTMFSNYLNGAKTQKDPATLKMCVLGPEEFLDSVEGMWHAIQPFLSQASNEAHNVAA